MVYTVKLLAQSYPIAPYQNHISTLLNHSYVAVNGMSLLCSKERRDHHFQQSEVHFLLLQVSIT